MGFAGGRHALISGAQPGMVDLPGDAEIGGQIPRADQQDIDAVDRGDGLAVLDAFAGFEHDDDRRLGVELRVQLGQRHGAVAERRSQPHDRALPERRKAACGNDRFRLGARVDIGQDDALRAAVEHPAHPLPVMARHPDQRCDADAQRSGADGRGRLDRVRRDGG